MEMGSSCKNSSSADNVEEFHYWKKVFILCHNTFYFIKIKTKKSKKKLTKILKFNKQTYKKKALYMHCLCVSCNLLKCDISVKMMNDGYNLISFHFVFCFSCSTCFVS